MLYRHIESPDQWSALRKRAKTLAIRLGGRFRDWRQSRQSVWHLRRLDDHLLADLGVKREQIAARVKGRL